MNPKVIAAALVVLIATSAGASAQSIEDLLKDHVLLRSELDRCKQLGLASNDDLRCKTARAAEQKRFFGSGPTYTEKPVEVYPNAPVPDPKPAPSSTGSPPHG